MLAITMILINRSPDTDTLISNEPLVTPEGQLTHKGLLTIGELTFELDELDCTDEEMASEAAQTAEIMRDLEVMKVLEVMKHLEAMERKNKITRRCAVGTMVLCAINMGLDLSMVLWP